MNNFIIPGEVYTHPGFKDVTMEVREIVYLTPQSACLAVKYHNVHMPEVINYDEVVIKYECINEWRRVWFAHKEET